jgi:hypothetical protein
MMAGYGAFIFIVLPLLSSAIAWAVTTKWKWYKNVGIEDEGEEETDGVEIGKEGGDAGGGELVISVPPSPGSATSVRKTLSDIREAVELGVILVVRYTVYRYRRWRRSRE